MYVNHSGEDISERCVCVVKVGSESFKRGNTFYHARTLSVLKRLTTYDLLGDEVDCVGTDEALSSIINLNDVVDGVYQLVVANVDRDWETGIIDVWDLKLVPYTTGE